MESKRTSLDIDTSGTNTFTATTNDDDTSNTYSSVRVGILADPAYLIDPNRQTHVSFTVVDDD